MEGKREEGSIVGGSGRSGKDMGGDTQIVFALLLCTSCLGPWKAYEVLCVSLERVSVKEREVEDECKWEKSGG